MRRGKGFGPLGTRIPDPQSGWFSAGRAKRNLSEGEGFTLIELLVVIAVIALLMAILVPVLRRARNHARAVVCQTNLKQWGQILASYTEDSQGRIPRDPGGGAAIWFLGGSSLSDDDPNKPPVYHPVRTEDIACCPMAVRPGGHRPIGATVRSVSLSGSVSHRVEGTQGSTFESWEITNHVPPFRSSYGFNTWLFSPDFDDSVPASARWASVNIFSLRGRARIPTLLDSVRPDGRPIHFFDPPPSDGSGFGFGWGSFCINRHNAHVNGLFLDWSVRKIGLKELWTLKWHLQFDTANEWTKAGGVQPEDWPQWMRRFKDY
jgi:prepilin-type N-terminal cleavage/methylation domain-containing protein/prepilin-type processing-associated H-X9-DG protein